MKKTKNKFVLVLEDIKESRTTAWFKITGIYKLLGEVN